MNFVPAAAKGLKYLHSRSSKNYLIFTCRWSYQGSDPEAASRETRVFTGDLANLGIWGERGAGVAIRESGATRYQVETSTYGVGGYQGEEGNHDL